MKYMVLTSKHHEGFCNWDTKLTNYNAMQFGPKRDVIREYVEAARAEGLRLGFYYSLMDWHHPDGAPRTRLVALWLVAVCQLQKPSCLEVSTMYFMPTALASCAHLRGLPA